MPASRSPSRDARKSGAPRRAPYWTLILVAVLAALGWVVVAMPAGIVTHFLPPDVQAADLSGSLWHGSMGKLRVAGRDAGGLEWRLHPASLLTLSPAAELHWVKAGFVIDGVVQFSLHAVHAGAIRGGGPVEDLTDLGIGAGWHGTADVALRDIASDYARITALAGDLEVSEVSAAQVGGGAPLGSYVLHFADDSVAADGAVTGTLKDLGGPVRVQGSLKLSAADRTGALSATLKAGPDLAPALRSELDNLAQLRGHAPDGSIPVDLEFTF